MIEEWKIVPVSGGWIAQNWGLTLCKDESCDGKHQRYVLAEAGILDLGNGNVKMVEECFFDTVEQAQAIINTYVKQILRRMAEKQKMRDNKIDYTPNIQGIAEEVGYDAELLKDSAGMQELMEVMRVKDND